MKPMKESMAMGSIHPPGTGRPVQAAAAAGLRAAGGAGAFHEWANRGVPARLPQLAGLPAVPLSQRNASPLGLAPAALR